VSWVSGVQSVGRLDVDTTGLLLLTDDGKFAHTITSPKHLKSKVYHVTCKHPLEDRYHACNAFVVHIFSPTVGVQGCSI
jgi:pseudouridine synthase